MIEMHVIYVYQLYVSTYLYEALVHVQSIWVIT